MRILIDMNLTPRWVAHFNGAGHEAHHLTAEDLREIDAVTSKVTVQGARGNGQEQYL